MIRLFIVLAVLLPGISNATNYWVRVDGNNSNNGLTNTAGGAWLTIAKGLSIVLPGDNLYVESGTYNEDVTINLKHGTSNSWLNVVGEGLPKSRSFTIQSSAYVRLIGFELTQTNYDSQTGIGISASTNWQIIDNYIHDTFQSLSAIRGAQDCYYGVVRGNTIDRPGYISGTNTSGGEGIGAYPDRSGEWVVEYNTIHRVLDFITLPSSNMVARNNYMSDYDPNYFSPFIQNHVDAFQMGSDGIPCGARNQVMERNYLSDSVGNQCHFYIGQDTFNDGDTNHLVRGNVVNNIGSFGIGVIAMDHLAAYNNTFFRLNTGTPNNYMINFRHWPATNPTNFANNGLVANNILVSNLSTSFPAIGCESSNTVNFVNNLGYIAGSDTSFVSTSDPLFIDQVNKNFRLQSGSPAKNLGVSLIWVTSTDGSGTSFNVNDGQLLFDGWGLVEGDIITVGTNRTTRVSSIYANTVTVTNSVTWTNNMPVFWDSYGTNDIGAFPYASTKMTSAAIASNNLTYTVTTVGNTRGVWFYVDGIPTSWQYDPPYTLTTTGGVVTAKAYALYAQDVPLLDATISGQSIGVSPSSLDFGNVLVGSSSNLTITVTNSGSVNFNGTASVSSPYAIVSGAVYSIDPSNSAIVTVSFTPIVEGVSTGSVTLTGGGGATVNLTGNAPHSGVMTKISGNVTISGATIIK